MNKQRILIAEDSEMNRAILASLLEDEYDIIEAFDGKDAITILRTYHRSIAAIMLDIVMPCIDGFGVLEEMRKNNWIDEIPAIMISSETSSSYIDRAFELGATEYISRPFAAGIIRRRIKNAMLIHKKKQQLIDVTTGWFSERERDKDAMISLLIQAIGSRNADDYDHVIGVEHLTTLLLHRMNGKDGKYMLSHSDFESISMASLIHDIGKILLPHEIVQKKGGLSPEEAEIYKRHTLLGAQIISELKLHKNERIVKYASEICHWHHERWNGEGYPDGLSGDNIPIAAQVVSVADVFDSLVNGRRGRPVYTHEKAFEMIKNGECGSFNPLLVKCLSDILASLKQDKKIGLADQAQIFAKNAVEDLFLNQDLTSSRISKQLEDANIKVDFISNISDELWFEYTTQPSSLRLSKGAADKTGLPVVIVDPLKNKDFCSYVGESAIEAIQMALADASPENSYSETTVKILLDGRLCRCQLIMMVLWSNVNDEYSSVLGKVENVDAEYEWLDELDRELERKNSEQILLPVLCDQDGCIRITKDQVGLVLRSYHNLFETVRIVDPRICMQFTVDNEGHRISRNEECFTVWRKNHRCDNCISQEVVRTRKSQSKVETIGTDVFYIAATCIEIDGIPYSLECVNPIHFNNGNVGGNQNILNELLVRNRQVYMDSATNVYNRRYFDDRIRNLTGEYAMAMIDVDKFKTINDVFGHPAGDAAIYSVAQTMRSLLRSNDAIIRYGGDEFFILFNNMPENMLQKKLEDICRSVRTISIPDYPDMKISTSIGGYYGSGRVSEMIKRADIALYKAKERKDCVSIYKENSNDAD